MPRRSKTQAAKPTEPRLLSYAYIDGFRFVAEMPDDIVDQFFLFVFKRKIESEADRLDAMQCVTEVFTKDGLPVRYHTSAEFLFDLIELDEFQDVSSSPAPVLFNESDDVVQMLARMPSQLNIEVPRYDDQGFEFRLETDSDGCSIAYILDDLTDDYRERPLGTWLYSDKGIKTEDQMRIALRRLWYWLQDNGYWRPE